MASTRAGGVFVPKSLNVESEDMSKLSEKIEKIKKVGKGSTRKGKGVIYLGHIPSGFFEPQMKAFFAQFGRVTRLRLSRSKKTGGSKGYAFVEFQHQEVAKIVAETMNNYLMFTRLLKCELLPEEKIHDDLFKGSHKRFSAPKAEKVAAERHNSYKTAKKEKRSRGRLSKKLKRLSDLGIQFEQIKEEKACGQSPVPEAVATPGGKLQVLKEDASDVEVTFKTPPGAIKSSRLPATPKVAATPKLKKKNVKRLK